MYDEELERNRYSVYKYYHTYDLNGKKHNHKRKLVDCDDLRSCIKYMEMMITEDEHYKEW